MTRWVSITVDCGLWTSCGCWLPNTGPLSGILSRITEQCSWEKEYLLSSGKNAIYLSKEPDLLWGLSSLSRPQENSFEACQIQPSIPAILSFLSPSLSALQNTVLQVVLWVPLTFISSPTYLKMSGGKQNFLKYSQNCEVAKLIFLYKFLLFWCSQWPRLKQQEILKC